MQLQDFAARLTIDPAKLTAYALNPNHPKGQHKARRFAEKLGYTADNYQSLLRQIENQALPAVARAMRSDQHGLRLQVDLEIIGVAGQHAFVRTGWLVAEGSETAVLVTLYVLE